MFLYRLALMVIACAVSWSFVPAQAQASKVAISSSPVSYMGRLSSNRHISGNCSAQMRPDRVFITGGVSGEGARPTVAKQTMQRKVLAFKSLARRYGGRFTELELIRSVKSDNRYSRNNKGPIQNPIYVVVQRFELDFPVKADIDAILEQVMAQKPDFIGDNMRRHRSSQPQVLARYRFSNLRQKIEAVQKRCRRDAYRQWCAINAGPGEQQKCTQALRGMDAEFITRSMSLQSQKVMTANGYPRNISLRYPVRESQLRYFILAGNVLLKFNGNISLRRNYRR